MDEKALVAIGKKAVKTDRFMWQLVDGVHYVSDGYVLVRLEHLSTLLRADLLKIFGMESEEGTTVVRGSTYVNRAESPDLRHVWNTFDDSKSHVGTLTRLTITFNLSKSVIKNRIVKLPDTLTAIDEKYVDLLDGANPVESQTGKANGMLRIGNVIVAPAMPPKTESGNTQSWHDYIDFCLR